MKYTSHTYSRTHWEGAHAQTELALTVDHSSSSLTAVSRPAFSRARSDERARGVAGELAGRDRPRTGVVLRDERAARGDGRARDREPGRRQLGLDPGQGRDGAGSRCSARIRPYAWRSIAANRSRREAPAARELLLRGDRLVEGPDRRRPDEQRDRMRRRVLEQPALVDRQLAVRERQPGRAAPPAPHRRPRRGRAGRRSRRRRRGAGRDRDTRASLRGRFAAARRRATRARRRSARRSPKRAHRTRAPGAVRARSRRCSRAVSTGTRWRDRRTAHRTVARQDGASGAAPRRRGAPWCRLATGARVRRSTCARR